MVGERKQKQHLAFWEHTALAALALELIGLAVYARAIQSLTALGILFLLALAATGSGGVLGFLFGIPRIRTNVDVGGTFLHNSNLEQISDWLTKIIVGATLVQLNDIVHAIGGVSLFIGREIAGDGSSAAAGSVMVFSFFAGFMWAYLWTSLRLKRQLDDSDAPLVRAGQGEDGKPLAGQPTDISKPGSEGAVTA